MLNLKNIYFCSEKEIFLKSWIRETGILTILLWIQRKDNPIFLLLGILMSSSIWITLNV